MSALPPKADIHCDSRNVSFVPKADMRVCRFVPIADKVLRSKALLTALSKSANNPVWLLSFEIFIAQAIDLYSG
jgi:hypothetical protein